MNMPGQFVQFWALLQCYYLLLGSAEERSSQKPNIIIILADDMGRNDVSFNNQELLLFQTPNIDALAYNGVILNDFHTASFCTPSRSALMTGKFPIHTGMQRLVILEAEPWGLDPQLKILPQYLKDVGYKTYLIGKWHLGLFEKRYMPTERGFNKFFGYLQGHQDYFTHRCRETYGDFEGYDMREDLSTRKDLGGYYTADLLTTYATYAISKHDTDKPLFLFLSQITPHAGEKSDPFQAPAETIKKFAHIKDTRKRKYAAMMSKLDESVGEVVAALKNKKMLENSIILFMSDNGAPTIGIHSNLGSNFPFRGMKSTEYEGGTRVPAVFWSKLIQNRRNVSNMMMHSVDVLPTLCAAAGIDADQIDEIDGVSMWDALTEGADPPRYEYVYNIDPADPYNTIGAFRRGEWKIYEGDPAGGDRYSWLGTKYSEGEEENFINYNIDKVLRSTVNEAISNLETSTTLENGADEKLDVEKIKQLREKTQIKCADLPLPFCKATETCLFNLDKDPCERYDFSQTEHDVYERLKADFETYRKGVVPPRNQPRDPCANPDFYDGFWTNWKDNSTVLQHFAFRGLVCKVSSIVGRGVHSLKNYLSKLF